jgi:hypothetical protein
MDGNDEFPNLRHNIFINNNALLYVKDLVVDTYISMFILVDDDKTESKVEGVEVLLLYFFFIFFFCSFFVY